jgi:hypothetical protein
VVGRSAFAAWVVAIHGGFGTRRLPELTGWARRAPVLGISLVLIAIASIGWPGFVAWQARSSLIQLALPGPIGLLVTIAPIGAVAIYGRIVLFGIGQPGPAVAEGRGERPRWPAPLTRRPMVAVAGTERAVERISHTLADLLDILRVLPAAGRTNRVPLAALAVLLLSGLAFLVAGGGLGVPEAARAVPEPGSGSGPAPTAPGSSGAPQGSEAPAASGSLPGEPSFAPVP